MSRNADDDLYRGYDDNTLTVSCDVLWDSTLTTSFLF